ncbi:MAG: sulfatase [Thermoanaerobaculia bacterium]
MLSLKKIFLLLFLLLSCRDKIYEKGNILLISLDDLRADSLGCYGYKRNTSPFMDYISTQGILYENAYVVTHGTFSSHSSILTGLYQESLYCQSTGIEYKVNERVPMVQEYLKRAGYFTIGVTDGGLLSKAYGFQKGFDIYDDQGNGIEKGTEKIINYLKQNENKGPFFVFYHTYDIHSPYSPPPLYDKIFGDFKSNINPTNEELLKYAHTAWKDLSEEDLKFLKARYDGSIRYVDDHLLKFFQKLEEFGFFKKYILILTSDHGEEFGEHGGLLHRDLLYEEIIHIPLIITGTGISKGKRISHLASHIDILPTLLKVAGIKKMDFHPGMDLFNIKMRKFIFCQYEKRRYAIRTEKFKFILNGNGKMELYNLLKDPQEKENLSEKNSKFCKKLKKELQTFKKGLPDLCSKDIERANLSKEDIEKLKSLGYIK